MTALAAGPPRQEPLAAAEEVETAPLELDPHYTISDGQPLNFVERAPK